VTLEDVSEDFHVLAAVGPSVGKWWVEASSKPSDGKVLTYQDPRAMDLAGNS